MHSGYDDKHMRAARFHEEQFEVHHQHARMAQKSLQAGDGSRMSMSKSTRDNRMGSMPELGVRWNSKKAVTSSGKAIPKPDAKHYKDVDFEAHRKDYRQAAGHNAQRIAPHFKGWTPQDHQDAAAHHEDTNFHDLAGAHRKLAEGLGKSMAPSHSGPGTWVTGLGAYLTNN